MYSPNFSRKRIFSNPAWRAWLEPRVLSPIIGGLIFLLGSFITVKKVPVETLDYLPDNIATHSMLDVAGRMKRPYGMSPKMFQAYTQACYNAGISPKILQTIGAAKASAGSHAKDGTVTYEGVRYDYSCAVDLRSWPFTDAQRKKLLSSLVSQGYAAWYRNRGSFANNKHFHIVWARYRMKKMLRDQVHDFVNGKTGLVGHARETYWQPSEAHKQIVRTHFLKVNPARG